LAKANKYSSINSIIAPSKDLIVGGVCISSGVVRPVISTLMVIKTSDVSATFRLTCISIRSTTFQLAVPRSSEKIHYQESSVISDVHRIAVVILLLYPLTAKEDYRSTHGSVVQFSYVFQHPYIVHQHVMCFFSGYIKEGSNTTIVRLYSVGCLIFNSKMVPKCLHVCVPHCFLGWLRTQWQTIDINKSLNICRIAS
jgi:hypothetical protein